jgi:hypothetical protein
VTVSSVITELIDIIAGALQTFFAVLAMHSETLNHLSRRSQTEADRLSNYELLQVAWELLKKVRAWTSKVQRRFDSHAKQRQIDCHKL